MKNYGLTQTVRRMYDEQPVRFHASKLISDVRVQLIRDGKMDKRPFDSTILRRLRQLRLDGKIQQWKCTDPERSIYTKQ